MHRDWTKPHLVQTATGPQMHPTPTLVNNVKPVYRFWNKHSDNYNFGEVELTDHATGNVPTSRPWVTSPTARPRRSCIPSSTRRPISRQRSATNWWP